MIKGKYKKSYVAGRKYSVDCEKYLSQFVRISVTEKDMEVLKGFCSSIEEAKMKEKHYQIDDENIFDRFKTGVGGELAVGKYLGVDTLNLTIGVSHFYNSGDLTGLGIDCGVKSVEIGKYHVIHAKPTRPEIMVIKETDLDFLICGLATVPIMRKYSDTNLIIDSKLRARETKTGFYGYQYLLPFKSIEQLKVLAL